MSQSGLLLFGFAVCIVVSLFFALRRQETGTTLQAFFFANSNLPAQKGIMLILSSPFSMNGLAYQVWLGYMVGWWALAVQAVWCASYLFIARYGEKLHDSHKEGSMHGAIGKVFGVPAERSAAIATIIGYTLQVGWELIVGASIFLTFAPQSSSLRFVLIGALAIIAAAYTMLGGLRGNAYANDLQNKVAMVVLLVLAGYLIYAGPGSSHLSTNHFKDLVPFSTVVTTLTIGGLITNVVFSLIWQFVDMSTWQDVAGTKRDASKKVLLWSALWVFIFPGVIGTIIGQLLRPINELTSDNILNHIIERTHNAPWLTASVGVAFVACMLSTIDGLLLATGQATILDLFRTKKTAELVKKTADASEETQESERSVIDLTRVAILGASLVGSILIAYINDMVGISIFDLVYVVVVAQMSLFPVVIVLLVSKTKQYKNGHWSILTGLLAGLIAVGYGFAHRQTPDYLTWSPMVGLVASSLAAAFFVRPIVARSATL